ncbi:hypothetical protein M9Y38_17975, partial [Escherichia coli]|nr:hypothetical protein [Escherichia coli]
MIVIVSVLVVNDNEYKITDAAVNLFIQI